MSSAAPAWAETSVRWLRTHRPESTPATSMQTFVTLLGRALVKVKFRYKEMCDERMFLERKWKETIAQTAENWTRVNHEQMVKFLETGGYVAPVEEKVRIPVTDVDGKVTGYEEIGLEMSDIEDAIDQLPAPKAQLSPRHELEEVVAAAVLENDPRYGAW